MQVMDRDGHVLMQMRVAMGTLVLLSVCARLTAATV